jgi:hypothetical protein
MNLLSGESFFEAGQPDIEFVRHFDEGLDIALEHIDSIVERAEPGVHVALQRSEARIQWGHNVIQLKDTDRQRAKNREGRNADREVELNIVHEFGSALLDRDRVTDTP